jgi:hypothetical protein
MNFEVYCDESRQDLFRAPLPGENYVLIGGVWLKADKRTAYKAAIRELREKHHVGGEFAWNRVSPSRVEFYLDLVRFFCGESADDLRFRVIVLRSDELNAVHFAQSDNELMFYKFYYQLLHHWILDCNEYRIFLDAKTNRLHGRQKTLERCLSSANLLSKVTVQALPSHEVSLIQLADVLIGAVGYKLHGLNTSSSKVRVVAELEKALKRNLSPTPKSHEKFNIFRFRSGGGW